MKKKWKYKKKKTNERGLYSLHSLLAFSLSRPRLENSMLSFAKARCPVNQWHCGKRDWEERDRGEKEGVKEMEEESGEGSGRDREKGFETTSYNRLLGSVMKQFSICLSHHLSLSFLHLLLSSVFFLCSLFLTVILFFLSHFSICFSSISHLFLFPEYHTFPSMCPNCPLPLFSLSLPLPLMFPFVSFCPFCLL